jgi:hypothetical protein
LFRRSIGVAAAVGLLVASVAVPADAVIYGAASTDVIADPIGDAVAISTSAVDEPRVDLTEARAIVHSNGRVELTASVAQPVDPTGPGWADAGAALMWILDTNADGNPDYLVGLALPDMTAVAVPYGPASGGPVAGCTPAVDHSPARYSVTVPGSCLGNPASFTWDVTMSYDADPADDANATATDTAPSSGDPAAGPGRVTDATGDVTVQTLATDSRSDVTAASAAYEAGRVTLTATVASPTDPRVDAGWGDGRSMLMWALDLDADDMPEYLVSLTGPDLAVHVSDADLNDLCTGSATYSPTAYSVSFDPSCVGSPTSFTWGVVMAYGDDTVNAFDVAPDGDTMAGPVTAPPPPESTPDQQIDTSGVNSGYWMITDAGDVHAFGDAHHLGNDPGAKRVDIEPTRSGNGYWILAASGAVTAKGDARQLGDAAALLQSGEQAAALSATPTGDGYWIFTDRGRVLSFGAAGHHGDMAGTRLNGPILDSVATPTGKGYWMVASDGGIFSFGDATFSGSTGNIRLNKPVMSMAADPDGKGYWLVASDGGIFAFDAAFHGSMGAAPLNKPISGIVPGNAGYLMVGEDGGIFAFGNVAFHGSLGAKPPANPVIAVALAPTAR